MTTTGLPSIAKIAELLGGEVHGGQVLCSWTRPQRRTIESISYTGCGATAKVF